MKSGETYYISLDYQLNKLETDLTKILDMKTENISFDDIKQIILTGDELINKIKNINIDKNKIDILKMMMSRVKTKIQEIEKETTENENDISTNSKEHKSKSKKIIIKKC